MNKNKLYYIYQNSISKTIWTMEVPPKCNSAARSFEFLASVYARDIEDASRFAQALYR